VTARRELVDDFLAQRRIAVAGVSRTETNAPANLIFRKLRDAGHEMFAVNPNGGQVEGTAAYGDLAAIPGGVDAVVVATPPAATERVVRDAVDAGVRRVWMHRAFGEGSVSEQAVAYCRDHDVRVIAGGCPMMYCEPVDFGHKCIRFVLGLTGGLPKGD
jgi:predicted CoA-binding protein